MTLYGIIILNSRLNVIILAIANNYNPHPSPLLTPPLWGKGKVASPLPPPSCLPRRGGVGNLEGKATFPNPKQLSPSKLPRRGG